MGQYFRASPVADPRLVFDLCKNVKIFPQDYSPFAQAPLLLPDKEGKLRYSQPEGGFSHVHWLNHGSSFLLLDNSV